MSLLESDKGNPKLPRHFKPSLKDDEFETPQWLYDQLCIKHQIFPKLDVSATQLNKKCDRFYSMVDNALEQDWKEDVWQNHPHSLHEQFAEKDYNEWEDNNINILSIWPANCGRTTYWHKYIENIAEYNMIAGAIRFLQNGKPAKDTSRNAYVCVRWRKR